MAKTKDPFDMIPKAKDAAPVTLALQETKAPESNYKTFTVARKAGGWSMVTTTIAVSADGQAKVIDVMATEPDLKALALEAFKIAAYNYWTKL